jgi:hypothetical protein
VPAGPGDWVDWDDPVHERSATSCLADHGRRRPPRSDRVVWCGRTAAPAPHRPRADPIYRYDVGGVVAPQLLRLMAPMRCCCCERSGGTRAPTDQRGFNFARVLPGRLAIQPRDPLCPRLPHVAAGPSASPPVGDPAAQLKNTKTRSARGRGIASGPGLVQSSRQPLRNGRLGHHRLLGLRLARDQGRGDVVGDDLPRLP